MTKKLQVSWLPLQDFGTLEPAMYLFGKLEKGNFVTITVVLSPGKMASPDFKCMCVEQFLKQVRL